jgi:hypothetical protein
VKLTPHFSLEELTQSQTAARLGLDNTPTARVLENLQHTADRMEEVRELLGGRSILVSSGFRSQKVNDAVGGALTSQHRYGLAVDFICPGFGTPARIVDHLSVAPIMFDQLIEEFGQWVHISFVRNNPRRQVLRFTR